MFILLGIFFTVGPIDAYRTIYNSIIGDVPVLKMELLNYSRVQIKNQYQKISDNLIEAILAERLQLSITKGNKIATEDVSIIELWDLVEIYPKSWKDRWIWTSLN